MSVLCLSRRLLNCELAGLERRLLKSCDGERLLINFEQTRRQIDESEKRTVGQSSSGTSSQNHHKSPKVYLRRFLSRQADKKKQTDKQTEQSASSVCSVC